MADDKKKGAEGAEKKPKGDKPAEGKGGGGGEKKAAAGGAPKGGGAPGKGDKKGKKEAPAPAQEYKRTAPPRLKTFYQKEVVPRLMQEFKYANVMQVPRLQKITSTWAWARRWPTRRSSTPPSRSCARSPARRRW
jgi:hypothetical protein